MRVEFLGCSIDVLTMGKTVGTIGRAIEEGRLVQEPRRMWKRYLVTNVKYGLLLIRAALAS